MEAVNYFKSLDGKFFPTSSSCENYENSLSKYKALENKYLGKRIKIKSEQYFQHDIWLVNKCFREALNFLVEDGFSASDVEFLVNNPFEKCFPLNGTYFWRILFESMNNPAYGLFNRLCRMDKFAREYEQPYFTWHPENCKRIN